MAPRFAGKVVIVSGSSNGIGRQTSIQFAEEGAQITITGRNQKALDETFDLLVAAGLKSENILSIQGDLLDEALHQKLIDETIKKFGRIDILVNNAGGVPDNSGATLGLKQGMESYDYTMNLNLKTVLSLSKLAIPHLAKNKGDIINVSSIAAYPWAAPSMPYYAIAKAGLDQLTRSMAGEFIKQGVRVNSVNPGLISTTIFQKQGITPEVQKTIEDMYAQTKFIPLGRVGQAREVAELICFLADRTKSEFIVGASMTIDGGSSILNPLMQGELSDLLNPK